MAISETVRDGKPYDDVRYFILSEKTTARRFGTLIRSHWGIENSLHWQLDMSFSEDQSRSREDHAAYNAELDVGDVGTGHRDPVGNEPGHSLSDQAELLSDVLQTVDAGV